jgi:hypothetical protein
MSLDFAGRLRRTFAMPRVRLLSATAAAFAALTGPAFAGPPYVTDDPVPTDRGHWEIYNYAAGSHTPGDTEGEVGVEVNYGGAENLQLNVSVPLAFDRADGTHTGLGDVSVGAKYLFLHQQENGEGIDVAVYPHVFLPTASRRFGSRRVSVLLPVWAGKDYGKWSVFGGGGYQLNPGAGNRDFWISGLALTRAVTDRLTVGAEVFHQTKDADDAKPYTGVNLGVVYKLNDHWALLASGGPGVQNAREGGQYDFYLGLGLNY